MIKALGSMIFGGSQTIGWMNAGFKVDKILEMTDDMAELNTYHFTKNYPNIEIVKPSVWENNKEYLEQFKGIDVVFGNPPCSGLSRINRNPSADNEINKNIYRYIDMCMIVKPKVIFFENAPTLTSVGLPILKKLAEQLKDEYRLTIISDQACNHSTAMRRRRTFFIAWRRDVFDKAPLVSANKQELFTVSDAIKGVTKDMLNMEECKVYKFPNMQDFYYLCKPGQSILEAVREHLEEVKDKITDKDSKLVVDRYNKIKDVKEGVWDKSPRRLKSDGFAPSMTSVARYMHPTKNRDLYIREYARLMGYPDDFEFFQDECKVPTIQCLAQGVPVKFIEYIANEIKDSLDGHNNTFDCDVAYINQNSGVQKIVEFTTEEFKATDDISKNKTE